MYQYTEFDRQFVRNRAVQYRDQLERNLAGTLGDDVFRPLRLQSTNASDQSSIELLLTWHIDPVRLRLEAKPKHGLSRF